MPVESHPDFIPVEFVLNVKGKDPKRIPVEGQDSINVEIPGGSKYTMTLRFKVKNRNLTDLKYKQVVKKGGITIRSREVEIGTYDASETEIYEKTFAEDETPGGWIMSGTYYCTSTYFAGDEQLIVNDWTLQITA